MKFKLGAVLVLAFLAFVFIIQNSDPVEVDFLVWSIQMSRVVLLLIMLGTGIIIGWALGSYLRYARNRDAVVSRGSGKAVVPGGGEKTVARKEAGGVHD